MRYLLRFLGVCALVLIPFIACMDLGGGEEGCESVELPPLCLFGDCEPDPCEGVVCPPDANVCTREYCSGGSCRSEPVTNGRNCTYDGLSGVCVEGVCGENLCEDNPCDDDDACTHGTCHYVDGTCDFTPVVCDDHEECTEDTCEPADGCVFTAVEDGTECSGRFGMCEAGSCVAPCDLASDEEYPCPIIGLEDLFCCPGSEHCRDDCAVPECERPEDCDDDDACTEDSCDPVDGTCHFTPVVCDDHNPCTEDTCDPADGCISTAVEDGTECGGRFGMCEASSCVAPCDLASDEEYQCPIIGLEDLFCCPGSESCRGDCTLAECQTPVDCDDENECTEDSCDYGNCYFTALVCDDHNPCTEDTCDPADGCVFTAVEDGTECGSGVCVGGECVEIECDGAEDCDDGNDCTEDICNGVVCEYPPVEDGKACANGAGACQAGSCVGVTAWTVQNSGTTAPLYGVSFTDANNGTVVGRYGTILRTTDGGATWVEQDSGTTNDLNAVSFTDANTGTVVGSNETILRTTDGGATWVEQDSDTLFGWVSLTGVSFTDALRGLAVGWHIVGSDVYAGAILRTWDGGATWVWEDSGTTNGLNAVSSTGYTAVGDYGTILRDDFWVWTAQDTYAGNDLHGVSFTDWNTGAAVGEAGIILRTTDGWATWSRQHITEERLYGVSFTDANTGTVVGSGGTILQTRDGGATWVAQESGTSVHLWGVSFIDANTGTAVGDNGTILRTTGGGGG